MRAIQTETGLSLGRIRSILEDEIGELIGGVDLRDLVKNKLFATNKTYDPVVASAAAEGTVAGMDIADERPSERAMRLSEPAYRETMAKEQAAAAVRSSRTSGQFHPPSHSIVKGK
jgi:hypothetical protein